MAGIACHVAVLMGELVVSDRRLAPGLSILLDRLCQARLLAVMRIAGRDCIEDLDYLPDLVSLDCGALKQLAIFLEKAVAAKQGSLGVTGRKDLTVAQHLVAAGSRRSQCLARGGISAFRYRAVAVFTANLDRVADFAIKFAIPMTVLLEMAIDAIHSLLEVDVFQLNRIPRV